MTIPRGVYPFATQDGKAIPLDIIKGNAVIVLPFTAGGLSTCTLPDYAVVGVLISKKGCMVQLGDTPVTGEPIAGDLIPNAVIIPDSGIVTVALEPGQLSVRGLDAAGILYIQLIEQWAAIGLATQYTRK